MKYSLAFKKSVLRRVLPPAEESVKAVSEELGVTANTIYLWLKKSKNGTLERDGNLSPNRRGAKEKLRLLLEGKGIPEEKQGEWLRGNGLHSEHLHQYEQEICEIVADKTEKQKEELNKLKQENKELKKELRKKEKALAEVAALLTLKKKWNEYLEEKEDD
jgi:transposase-like protein